MAEDEEGNEYRWETGYEKTWEAIKEDDDGLLEASVADIIQKAKRKRQQDKCKKIRLGMMRHLYLIIDWSECMSNQDLKPTRYLCTIKLLEGFIEEYFDQNPISQLGVIIARNKRAEKIAELSGNPRKHIKTIEGLKSEACSGEMSLQNSLSLALDSLRHMPSHASREILVLMGSLTTCDPGDIMTTIADLKSNGIRCSVIGLAAETHVCKRLVTETTGKYGVILDDCHYREQLYEHVDPPPAAVRTESALIKMGFPHHEMQDGKDVPLSLCTCHAASAELSTSGYLCPQCCSKYCELPTECATCGLTLVSAPHLARSYHHLFPVDTYLERGEEWRRTADHCYACIKPFSDLDKTVFECRRCAKLFCLDCDLFVHDTLHTCPGCTSISSDTSLVRVDSDKSYLAAGRL